MIKNPYPVFINGYNELYHPFEFEKLSQIDQIRILGVSEGWQEGHDALKKWLFEPCTEHKYDNPPYEWDWAENKIQFTAKYHYLCPECMRGL